jgi:hypothetical protein
MRDGNTIGTSSPTYRRRTTYVGEVPVDDARISGRTRCLNDTWSGGSSSSLAWENDLAFRTRLATRGARILMSSDLVAIPDLSMLG